MDAITEEELSESSDSETETAGRKSEASGHQSEDGDTDSNTNSDNISEKSNAQIRPQDSYVTDKGVQSKSPDNINNTATVRESDDYASDTRLSISREASGTTLIQVKPNEQDNESNCSNSNTVNDNNASITSEPSIKADENNPEMKVECKNDVNDADIIEKLSMPEISFVTPRVNHVSQADDVVHGDIEIPQNIREWSSGLFGCFSDCSICIKGYVLMPCLLCDISSRLGECVFLPLCLPGTTGALRTKVRTLLGIKGSILIDSLTGTFCGPLVACQIARELRHVGM